MIEEIFNSSHSEVRDAKAAGGRHDDRVGQHIGCSIPNFSTLEIAQQIVPRILMVRKMGKFLHKFVGFAHGARVTVEFLKVLDKRFNQNLGTIKNLMPNCRLVHPHNRFELGVEGGDEFDGCIDGKNVLLEEAVFKNASRLEKFKDAFLSKKFNI